MYSEAHSYVYTYYIWLCMHIGTYFIYVVVIAVIQEKIRIFDKIR